MPREYDAAWAGPSNAVGETEREEPREAMMNGTKALSRLVVALACEPVSSRSLAMAASRCPRLSAPAPNPASDGCRRREPTNISGLRKLRFVIMTDVKGNPLKLTDPLPALVGAREVGVGRQRRVRRRTLLSTANSHPPLVGTCRGHSALPNHVDGEHSVKPRTVSRWSTRGSESQGQWQVHRVAEG